MSHKTVHQAMALQMQRNIWCNAYLPFTERSKEVWV